MKKNIIALVLTFTMIFTLAACSGEKAENTKAPEKTPEPTVEPTPEVIDADLAAFYQHISSNYELGFLSEITGEMLDAFYPGLQDYKYEQFVAYMPNMSSVVSEYVFLECTNEADVEAVKKVLQTRIDTQAEGGAWYPESVEAWGKAVVISNGNYVAMIASMGSLDDIVKEFNALFE